MDRDNLRKRARSPRGGRFSTEIGSFANRKYPGEYRDKHAVKNQDRSRDRQDPVGNFDRGDDKALNDKVKSIPVACPPGFPSGYIWSKGDWLCPSPGCEGYVTSARFQNCINCGRSMPFFVVLTELAKQAGYMTEMCQIEECGMRHCSHAHSKSELRNLERSRDYRKPAMGEPKESVAVPGPSLDELRAFIHRWKIEEPRVSGVLHRLPAQLGDLVVRTFYVEAEVPDSETSQRLLKCLADLIRPRIVQVISASDLHELLPRLLRRSQTGVSGVACSEDGYLAVTLEKEVACIACSEMCSEDLGLLAFSLAFNGMAVVHSMQDKLRMSRIFPKLYVNLLERVRFVDNPSEIIYVADARDEALADRATQARLDSLTPSPLLPTPSVPPDN